MIDCLPQNQKNEETENTKFQKAGEVLYFKKVFREESTKIQIMMDFAGSPGVFVIDFFLLGLEP
jgi:hypothetical protein